MFRTSIDIWLPQLTPALAPWRTRSQPPVDPGVAPHLSLLFPWIPGPPATGLRRLANCLSDFRCFELSLTEIGRFPGVLWLAPEDPARVRALMHGVAAEFPECPLYGGEFDDPKPHLTVARGDGEHLDGLESQLAPAVPTLPLRDLLIDRVTVVRESGAGWAPIAEIPLRRRG